MTPAATKLTATIILFFISSSSISYFNYSLLKLAELDASVTRKYDKCHIKRRWDRFPYTKYQFPNSSHVNMIRNRLKSKRDLIYLLPAQRILTNKKRAGFTIPASFVYSSLNPCNFKPAIRAFGFLKSSILSSSGSKK